MADHLTSLRRSEVMSSIRGRDTKPELLVRRILHTDGFRFRLHQKKLPGRPDLVLRKYRTVIFVNGCFWHGHSCPRGKLPKTNTEFWKAKIGVNKRRDTKNQRLLRQLDWSVHVVWTCKFEEGIRAILRKLRKKRDDKVL